MSPFMRNAASGQKDKAMTEEKSHRRSFLFDVLGMIHIWLMIIGVFGFFAAILKLTGGAWFAYVFYSLVLFLPAALSYVLIRCSRKFVLYTVCALAVTLVLTIGGAALGDQLQKPYGAVCLGVCTVVGCLVIWIVRMVSRIQQSQEIRDFRIMHENAENVVLEAWETESVLNHPSAESWAWLTVLYLIGVFAGFKSFYRLTFYALVADVFLVLLTSYFYEYHMYIRQNHGIANLPVSMMRRVHKTILAVVLAAAVIGVLPALMYGREPLDDWLRNRPVNAIDVTFEEAQEDASAAESGDYMMNALEELDDGQVHEMPAWVKALMDATMYALCAVLVIAIAWAAVQKLKEISRDYAQEDQDEVVFLDDAGEDAVELLYGGKKKREGFLSVTAQIRRRYRRAITRGGAHPAGWEAPAELELDANWTDSQEALLLHETYEKARYSKDGCTREDLDKLKK